MTEAEWEACPYAGHMLSFLAPSAERRKLRLFTVGCFRRVENLLARGSAGAASISLAAAATALAAVEWLELLADAQPAGEQTPKPRVDLPAVGVSPSQHVLIAAHHALYDPPAAGIAPRMLPGEAGAGSVEARAAMNCSAAARLAVAADAAGPAPPRVGPRWHADWMAAHAAEAAAQATLFRCIFGNPMRPAPAVVPAWLSWESGTVPCLAQAIYDNRAFDHCGILADALEEAGCEEPQILKHLRSGTNHYRGCHVLDAILGKS
jgi:hypothetical protein